MRTSIFKFIALLSILAIVLAGCGGAHTPAPAPTTQQEAAPTEAPAAEEEEAEPTEAPMEEPTEAPAEEATEAPEAEAAPTEEPTVLQTAVPAEEGKVQVRWFVGLGTGTDPAQIEVENQVVEAFNASHPDIQLVLEVVDYDAARDTLSTQIASGNPPDIVGPVGVNGAEAFHG
ncbi:MAG TPA: extracellular solute-binding protein, partial [Ardenticatenaceae bacterium]|nr:extracellular solute-binding protein [Ardenticatenaceae bacterium]